MPTIVHVQRANRGPHFRAYGLRGLADVIDPFIGVDHAWMSAPTFPPHPHAGFSAVSYVFLDSETGIANRDSIGTRNLIAPGGVHWMVAGKGVVHEEVPAEAGLTVHSLQIFVNLPPAKRADAPYAVSLAPQDVPTVLRPGAKVRVVAGEFDGHRSPAEVPTAVNILDIALDADGGVAIPLLPGRTAFVLPIFGAVAVDGQHFSLDDLKVPVFPAEAGARAITLHAPAGAAKVMVFGGTPLYPTPSVQGVER